MTSYECSPFTYSNDSGFSSEQQDARAEWDAHWKEVYVPRSTERDVEMIALREAGSSVADIAWDFGLSRARVYQILAQYGRR